MVSLNVIYKELLSLKKEVAALREALFIGEVEPLDDEIESIKEYQLRKSSGKVEFSSLEEI